MYEGAPISIGDSMAAILSYVIRHELDGKQIVDLMQLVNLHCKSEKNEMKTSLYFFKKYFSCLDCPVIYHYYCSSCYANLKEKKSQCPNAELHTSTSGTCIFVELPLIPQLQSLFTQEEFYSNLNYKHTRNKVCQENLEDIYDGQIYKELESNGFFSKDKPLNFSLIMNTDGVPVFKSTNKSLWPVFFNVNELPPHLRFKKEYTLIGGIWFGGKPYANLILEPLLKPLKTIESGFAVTPPTSEKSAIAKGVVIAATTDLPAKVMICGMASYSGAFGCQICKLEGGSVKIIKKKKIVGAQKKNTEEVTKTSSVWVYRFTDDLELRSHSETIQLGIQAQRVLQETNDPKTNILGVKYPSAFFKIMYDGIRGFAIDDLHTMYLGVTKTLIRLLFDSNHSTEVFSLRKYLSLVDQRLMAIQLPNFLERGVKKIETDIAFWKGTEFQTWAHYLSIPILDGIMSERYLEHYVDLISCIHILQSSSIPPEALLSCDKTLTNFVKNFEVLYGTRYMTMVFHLLRHMVFVVDNLGPMRHTSCFPYENLNGDILKMIHGTRYVETQLASACFLIKQLPKSLENLSSQHVREFCNKLLHPSLRLKKLESIDSSMFSVGTYKLLSSQCQYAYDALAQLGIQKGVGCTIQSFLKLKKGKLLFVSRSYLRSVRTNSFTCTFLLDNDTLRYGAIDIFVKVSSNFSTEVRFFAIIQLGVVLPYVIGKKQVPHISRYSLSKDYVAIPINQLRDMLVCVQVGDKFFVCQPIY